MFTTTIKAKVEYIVKSATRKVDGTEWYILYDGDEMIMAAEKLSKQDHLENLEGNECYHVCERFITRTGAMFIYARDEEADVDYLIRV